MRSSKRMSGVRSTSSPIRSRARRISSSAITRAPRKAGGRQLRVCDGTNRLYNWLRHGSLTKTRGFRIGGCHRTSGALSRGGSPRAGSLGFFGELGEVGPDRPQLGEHLVLDQPREKLDPRALRADDVLADHAADHLHVAEPPHADLLVP